MKQIKKLKNNMKQNKIEQAKIQLFQLVKENTLILVNIHKVSASGMTRKMSAYVIKEGRTIKLNYLVRDLGTYNLDKNGHLIVQGCGMDMAFGLTYNIKAELYGCAIADKNQQYRAI